MAVELRIRTEAITVVPEGMPINGDHEDILVEFTPSYPWAPPVVRVEHGRFVGYPHVLQGERLCIYLDPSQEWHPSAGVRGFLDRLWKWFEGAAGGKFDPARALFHPVGGVDHQTPGTPTVVVRAPLPRSSPGFAQMALRRRTERRLDLIPTAEASEEDLRVLILALSGPLQYGAGLTLGGLLARLELVGTMQVAAVVQALGSMAGRNPSGSALYLVLAVPGAAPVSPSHLVCGRLSATAADSIRRAVDARGRLGQIDVESLPLAESVAWCHVSEEREAATTRRDAARPAARFLGREIVIWGCGGLGSWVGEFVARAGARRLSLADPSSVDGGLLVRQNYVEADIGLNKAEALAGRLRAVRDDLDIVVASPFEGLIDGSLPPCDILVDSTVSNTVSAAISSVWATTETAPLVARLSTDRKTSTLGLLTISRPGGQRPNMEDADRMTGEKVMADSHLESFRCFWESPADSDELYPEPGCSVPTFHGAATDIAAIAATASSLLAAHLAAPDLVGSHIFALAHSSEAGLGHRWVSLT